MFTLEIKTENAAFKDPFTGEEDNIVEATEIKYTCKGFPRS